MQSQACRPRPAGDPEGAIMRTAYLLTILCAAALYTYSAFTDLDFLSSTGRLGPGFFPRLIGCALAAACLYSLVVDTRRRGSDAASSPFWQPVALIAVLSALLVVLLSVLGGLPAMIVFLLASLFMLNRGRPVQNAIISLLLPLGIYALFDLWLHASMPEGLVPLPI
jgi:uncharacterized membrane protein YhaH (DUF805 family)